MDKKPNLRVLSGKFKGQKIISPQSQLTHPMGSREKLALFNMLQPYLEGVRVLDIYAGTGALGIEALSRGAREAIFVEKSPQIARILRQNLRQIAVSYKVFTENASDFVQNPAFTGYFDVILADPPYDGFDSAEMAKLPQLLQNNGILALSFPFTLGAPELPGMELLTVRKYAAAGIAIYRKTSYNI